MDDQHTLSNTAATATDAANNLIDSGKARIDEWQKTANSAIDQAKTTAHDLSSRVQDTARQVQDKARATTDVLYEQGSQARDYMIRNMEERPLMALLVAGAVGYGLAYLIHRR
jgi:ElaB/YqjD/DUF883 family membrane-anchored ribosome-binding protein